MKDRIIQVFKELKLTPYRVEKDFYEASGLRAVTIRNAINGKTATPHQSTWDTLTDYLCEYFKVSRLWLEKGEGEIYLKDDEDFYIEKLGVRFELSELIKHFEENKEIYFSRSKDLMLYVIEELIENKEKYFELSEFLRLFINDSVEQRLEKRLAEIKELGKIVNAEKRK